MEAYDTATPNLRGSCQVSILVKRNENRPIFSKTDYKASITAAQPLGETIVTVVATDTDQVTTYK